MTIGEPLEFFLIFIRTTVLIYQILAVSPPDMTVSVTSLRYNLGDTMNSEKIEISSKEFWFKIVDFLQRDLFSLSAVVYLTKIAMLQKGTM